MEIGFDLSFEVNVDSLGYFEGDNDCGGCTFSGPCGMTCCTETCWTGTGGSSVCASSIAEQE